MSGEFCTQKCSDLECIEWILHQNTIALSPSVGFGTAVHMHFQKLMYSFFRSFYSQTSCWFKHFLCALYILCLNDCIVAWVSNLPTFHLWVSSESQQLFCTSWKHSCRWEWLPPGSSPQRWCSCPLQKAGDAPGQGSRWGQSLWAGTRGWWKLFSWSHQGTWKLLSGSPRHRLGSAVCRAAASLSALSLSKHSRSQGLWMQDMSPEDLKGAEWQLEFGTKGFSLACCTCQPCTGQESELCVVWAQGLLLCPLSLSSYRAHDWSYLGT